MSESDWGWEYTGSMGRVFILTCSYCGALPKPGELEGDIVLQCNCGRHVVSPNYPCAVEDWNEAHGAIYRDRKFKMLKRLHEERMTENE